ncbi:5-formyltetrahydrofolate cyclo-ligase [Helicobacter cetorum]|uniref:5-formyltetrahydrofolate cyclo-ligase n=1 Tax=Helicobacter cetorum TaxID=138563 RepID=UPI0005C4D08E|nr:5-formyltetrahydrofolate cyclo-ligase [Helicobacter cetorum]
MFREFCKERLKRVRTTRDALVCRLLYPKLKRYKSVLLYCPLKHELDLLPLAFKLRQLNKRVWLPQSLKQANSLCRERFDIAPFRLPLRRLKFFDEPSPSCFYKRRLDCIIVPILGMDMDFRRVGFGAGMYDRSLPKLLKNQRKQPLVVFVSRELIMASKPLTHTYDIQANLYVNPRIVIKNNQKVRYGSQRINLCFIRSHCFLFDNRSNCVSHYEKDLSC